MKWSQNLINKHIHSRKRNKSKQAIKNNANLDIADNFLKIGILTILQTYIVNNPKTNP